MPVVPKRVYKERLARDARCSNHAIMLLDDYEFFQTSNAWIFPVRRTRSTAFVVVDPLRPEDGASLASPEGAREFDVAISELEAFVGRRRMAFVGVSRDFARLLGGCGFKVLKAGEEPWVSLAAYEPRGDAGKGVRAARNKALRAGCRVQEWPLASVLAAGERQETVRELFAEWSASTLVHLQGLFLAVDPFADIPGRRFFVVTAPSTSRAGVEATDAGGERVEAILVATPVEAGRSYYFEDTVYRDDAPDGVVELVMLGAMKALETAGVKEVSLGVVPFRNIEELHSTTKADAGAAGGEGPEGDPCADWRGSATDDDAARRMQRYLARMKDVVARFYNVDGLALSRKRFRPQRWDGVFLCYRARLSRARQALDPRAKPSVLSALRVHLGRGLWKASSGEVRVLAGIIVDLVRLLKPRFGPADAIRSRKPGVLRLARKTDVRKAG